jgi:GNAT superfamily N-acetyltransferase
MSNSLRIRLVAPDENMIELTELVHAAYAERASNNLRYWATHQSVEDTTARFRTGQGLVAETDSRIVGTVTVRPPQPNAQVAYYRDPQTWSISQFGVLPQYQGLRIGRQLHDAALSWAWNRGGRTMGLDTAAPAIELIDMYIRWGYTIVGAADFRPHTNYISVIMLRRIAEPPDTFLHDDPKRL